MQEGERSALKGETKLVQFIPGNMRGTLVEIRVKGPGSSGEVQRSHVL